MKILVTNDDGIHAEGMWALVGELTKVGSVTVVAPDRDQSGVGTAVTLRHPLRLHKVKSMVDGVPSYSVEGTPADSVILAIRSAMKEGVDLVVSGINEGPNLGNDIFISGTVGAALQGYFYRIPAIAISVAAFEDLYLEAAAKLAGLLANEICKGLLPSKLMLNVNVPNMPKDKIEGIEVTRIGERSYTDGLDKGHDGKRDYYWIVRGVPQWEVNEGTDIWALERNRISISPFLDDGDSPVRATLKEMAPNLFDKLRNGSI